MKRLVILDYTDFTVHFFDVDTEEDSIDVTQYGFKETQCSYMIGNKMNIEFHKEILK